MIQLDHGFNQSSKMTILVHDHQSSCSLYTERLLKLLQLCCCWAVVPIVLIFLALINWYLQHLLGNVSSVVNPGVIGSTHEEKLDGSSSGECDISKGKWVPDSRPPLYSIDCKYIQLYQNCQRNGRPDKDYLHWRWKPNGCDLPPFDPVLFLQLMTNKKLAFIGDSLARNHMQSLICSLTKIEQPELLYEKDDKDFKYEFPSYNFTLALFWSPFLVQHQKQGGWDNPPLMYKLHLDIPEDVWESSLSEYDVSIISTGQWYYKPSIYYLNHTAVGCYGCSDKNLSQVAFTFGYRNALGSVLKSIAAHAGYKGTTVLRTFSMEHFEYGAWNTGGTCNRTSPFLSGENMTMGWTPTEMNRIQVEEFDKASARGTSNGSKLRLFDVTYSAFLRPDGHAGPYRRPFVAGSNKTVQSDCLHWCLPGPIDMWNQLILNILK